jgi:uncharacterized protein YbjT (DUF2867 family)
MNKNFFLGKNILVTGGTGSFGQAFTKVILRNYKPKRLIILERTRRGLSFKTFLSADNIPILHEGKDKPKDHYAD